MSFVENRTSRNDDADRESAMRDSEDYDEKEDLSDLREKLQARKKPIAIALGCLALAIIGTSVAVSTGKSSTANTKSGQGDKETTVESTTAPPASTPAATESDVIATVAAPAQWSRSSSGSTGHNEDAVVNVTQATNYTSAPPSTSPAPTTPAPTTGKPTAAYKAVDFDWTNPSNWETSGGSSAPSGAFSDGAIKLTPATSKEPIRTKQGWDGEKIVLIEWERSDSSDTNIWMLNTKLKDQFSANNGWPHWGELDIFEMFTADKALHPSYDYTGADNLSPDKYGQLTMHMGSLSGQNCMCPASPSKTSWFQGQQPLTSGCTAQFSNDKTNSMATVWGSDSNGKYIQLLQKPKVTEGGQTSDGAKTYDVQPGDVSTPKFYSNSKSFWGLPASDPCASIGGHDPDSGFPFFESFRIILEEQKKDSDAWFKVTNIQILKKN